MQSLTAMNISTPPISLYWWTADTVQLAAEVRRYSVLALQTVLYIVQKSHFLLKKVTFPITRDIISCCKRRKFIFAHLYSSDKRSIMYIIM